jgi:hypothetical protein
MTWLDEEKEVDEVLIEAKTLLESGVLKFDEIGDFVERKK